MKCVNVFYQGEGIREIGHIEADGEHTFAAVKLLVVGKHGLPADVLVFLEDNDEPVDELLVVRDHARPSGIKIHLHRCRQVEIHVTFNGETVHHRFGPGATVARVKRWAAERKFGMNESEASEHVLQIAGSHDRPAPGTHLGTLVSRDLHRALRAKGFAGGYDAVRRHLNRRIGSTGRPGRRNPAAAVTPNERTPPSARKLSFRVANPKPDGHSANVLAELRARNAAAHTALATAEELMAMIRKEKATTLAEWVAKATALGDRDLSNLAAGLASDAAAVQAALTEPWSNGQVEGQVGRLNIIATDAPDRHSPSLTGYTTGRAVDGVPRTGRLGPPTSAGRTRRAPVPEPHRPEYPPAR